MVKKLFSATFVLVLTLVFLSGSSSQVLATNHPSWHWETQYISQFQTIEVAVDDRCDDANPAFKVTVFEGHNYTGARARLCGYWDDLGQIPQYPGSSSNFNNTISSVWVKDLPENSNYYVLFSNGKDQEGLTTPFPLGKYDLDSLADNKFSSVKRVLYPY